MSYQFPENLPSVLRLALMTDCVSSELKSSSLYRSTALLSMGHCFVLPVGRWPRSIDLGVDLYLPRSIPRPYSLPRRSRSRSHTWRWSGCPGSSAGRPRCPSGSPPRGSGGWGRGPDGESAHVRWPVTWQTAQEVLVGKFWRMFMTCFFLQKALRARSQWHTSRWVVRRQEWC